MDHADPGAAVLGAGYHHAPLRNAAHEVCRAVNRINDPIITRSAVLAAVFLTNDAVIGPLRFNGRAHQRFGVLVGVGHQVLMALAFNHEGIDGLKMAMGESAGFACHAEREVKPGLIGHDCPQGRLRMKSGTMPDREIASFGSVPSKKPYPWIRAVRNPAARPPRMSVCNVSPTMTTR